MSETKIQIPKETREKLAAIASKLGTLNTGSTGDVFWLAQGDGDSNGYDWSQVELGVDKKGNLVSCDQSGCSCNGPEAPEPDAQYPLDAEILIDAGYDNDGKNAVDDLIPTVETLYKVLVQGDASPQEIIGLPNSEVRRAVVELVGYDKIVAGAETLDESLDGKLLKIPLSNDEDIVVVHVKDPSTEREYFLRVPPDTKTAKQARAWTFGFEAQDFDLTMET